MPGRRTQVANRLRDGRGHWSRVARGVLLAGGIVLVVWALRAWPGGSLMFGWARGPRTGERAPAIEATTIDGRRLSLAGLRGRVVLVNFWATWCGPCRTEMPAIERLWRERARDGFTVLGLSQDESTSDVVVYVTDRRISYPIAMATPAQARDYGVTALPTSYLVDRRGRVRHMVLGAFPDTLLRRLVGTLLAEPGPAAGPTGAPAAASAPPTTSP